MRHSRYPKAPSQWPLPILDAPILSTPKHFKLSITLSEADLPTDRWLQCGLSPQVLTGLWPSHSLSQLPVPLGTELADNPRGQGDPQICQFLVLIFRVIAKVKVMMPNAYIPKNRTSYSMTQIIMLSMCVHGCLISIWRKSRQNESDYNDFARNCNSNKKASVSRS